MHRALLALIISSVLMLIGAAGLYAFKATDLDQARPLAIIGPRDR